MDDQDLLTTPTLGPEVVRAPAGTGGDDSPAAERVRRLRARFLQVWNHALWRRWRKEAKEDFDFMSGVGQWDADTKARLEAKHRTVLTINEIRPVVEVVVGYERGARLDLKPVPEGQEDLEDVTILGRLMKRVMTDLEGDFVLSDGFKVGLIGGLSVWYIGVDYTEDPVHGKPTLLLTKPGEVVWDPDAQAYDLRDAREVFWHKMVAVDELTAQYPERAADIKAALSAFTGATPPGSELVLASQDPVDAYKESIAVDALPLYDPASDEVRVLEAWYRDWDVVQLLVDEAHETVEEVPDTPTARDLARELVKLDPHVKLITRKRKTYKTSVFLPATGQELEHGTPFENDDDAVPFVPYLAYRERDEILGLVRNLKDPQREVNKRRSALADMVARHGSMRWLSPRNALENPAWLTDPGEEVGWLRNPQSGPTEFTPKPLPEWIWRMDEKAKNEIREISGVNAPLQGQASAAESGIAIARLQVQGQIITTGLFDNYRRSRRLIGQRLAKRIQQVFTGERTVRLAAESGGSDFVTLNRQEVDAEGRVTVVRNIPDLRFDVTISEAPSTPTARSAALAVLFELIEKLPALGPALADILIELTDIPDRERVLQRVRAVLAGATAGAGAVPTGGNGSVAAVPPEGASLPPGDQELLRRAQVMQGLPAGLQGVA